MPEIPSIAADLWSSLGGWEDALGNLSLPAGQPVFPSSFEVGTAAQVSIGMAALAANEIYRLRQGSTQNVEVTRRAAELECTGFFTLDGEAPEAWEKFSGVYATSDGFVRVHANFDHHRDGFLSLIGCSDANGTAREDAEHAVRTWRSSELESAAAESGLVVSAVRTFDAWDRHPHALATVSDPVVRITRIGEAEPRQLASLQSKDRPLHGVRVLDLTRILAGPTCGRTLAAYGADVMLINSPNLPNIAAIADTSRGKRSVHLDLKLQAGVEHLRYLTKDARIFVQGYRPDGLASLSFDPHAVADIAPGIVYVSLSAYGWHGPWSGRRGFDSLVQAATGFNDAEATAAGVREPKSMPLPILDYASGFLMAAASQLTLKRQIEEGGSWHVEVSLYHTARWIRSLGRTPFQSDLPKLHIKSELAEFPSNFGTLLGLPHAAHFSTTPAVWHRASSPPGTDTADWGA